MFWYLAGAKSILVLTFGDLFLSVTEQEGLEPRNLYYQMDRATQNIENLARAMIKTVDVARNKGPCFGPRFQTTHYTASKVRLIPGDLSESFLQ